MQLSPAEIASSRLSAGNLEMATAAVRNNGYVLFERILPDDLVADMRNTFGRLLETHATAR